MSKFLVTKKHYSDSNAKFIVGKQVLEIDDINKQRFSAIKKHFKTFIDIAFDSCGGNNIEGITLALGDTFSDLPTPIKSQHIFLGWFTSASGGNQITSETLVSLDINTLYAQWEEVQIASDCTSYSVTTASLYKNTGIYTASIADSSQPIYIDWGDGTVEKLTSSISQKCHTYKTVGNFTVKISDNITSFAPSYNNGEWFGKEISQNRYTFKGMLTTGSKVTSLPAYAFYNCLAIPNIDFMQTCWPTVTSLPNHCFYYCSSLSSIQGAKRFTSLGQYCFYCCNGLTGIQDLSEFKFTALPDSHIFASCTNVTQWILPSGFTGTVFGNHMFYKNTKLSSLVLPNSLTSTGTYIFQNCSNLSNIIIPSKIQSIDNYAFYGCTSLSNVNIEATNLTAINQDAFCNCNKLTDLDLPDTIKTIKKYAFYGCTSLNYIGKQNNELPSQLTSIGSYAYQGCSNLKSLNIPENLQTIEDYAFAGCYQISSIVDKRLSAQTVSTNTFGNTTDTGTNGYTGYQTKGNNVLSTYFAVTGYDEDAWDDPLQNPNKCGFIQQYIDPENVVYHTVTFDAGIGSISETSRSIIKGKKIGELPIPIITGEQLYFGGWSTTENDSNAIITKNYKVTSDTTLYALYSDIPFANYEVILNDQWQASTIVNPDSSQFDGVYESFSNYNIGSKTAAMYIKIKGYTTFTIYIRSYAESSCDYTVAFNLDTYTPSNPLTSNPSSDTSDVKAHTSGKQNSETAIGSYTKVEYTGIDGGEHYICVAYRKDGSVNNGTDRGYVLIEKQDVGAFEPASYITVKFEVGEGTLVSGETTTIDVQGSTLSRFPEISAPISKPYLVGWNTMADGSGEYYDAITILPNQESLTLYAYYADEDPIDPNKDIYLCFTAEQANSTIQLSAVETAPAVYLETSRTCNNISEGWSDFVVGETAITLDNVGDKVYFRAKQDNNVFATSTSNYNCFVMTGKIAASGNLNTLLKADGSVLNLTGRNYCYAYMFYGCTALTQAPKLPATVVANGCYYSMFQGCSSLTAAPELPAMTVNSGCYRFMFCDCTSLTQAPALPATTLNNYCYYHMFENCISLTQAPELPAMTVNSGCYYSMFQGCTSLTSAPELPATVAASYCYYSMFSGCTSLTAAPELPATKLANNCYQNMFYGCTSLTQAPSILPAETLVNLCYYSMFQGCSSLTQAPDLLATNLASSCCYSMFHGCTSLIQAPELPVEILASGCYQNMFQGCISLTAAPELPATTLIKFCYSNMFYGCTTLTQTPSILPAETLAEGCYRSMFDGCTSLTQAPELPATTLTKNCYNYMFQDCTSLSAAPELPATTLAEGCYNHMFNNCTALTQAPSVLPAETLISSCYDRMFRNCISLTAAPELPATTLDYCCYYRMFLSCISLTAAPELPAMTLANWCYREMFCNCKSLTQAPALSAATLVDNCYDSMFYGCTKLNNINVNFLAWDPANATTNWVRNISALGTFTCPADLPETYGTSYMPTNWTLVRK